MTTLLVLSSVFAIFFLILFPILIFFSKKDTRVITSVVITSIIFSEIITAMGGMKSPITFVFYLTIGEKFFLQTDPRFFFVLFFLIITSVSILIKSKYPQLVSFLQAYIRLFMLFSFSLFIILLVFLGEPVGYHDQSRGGFSLLFSPIWLGWTGFYFIMFSRDSEYKNDEANLSTIAEAFIFIIITIVILVSIIQVNPFGIKINRFSHFPHYRIVMMLLTVFPIYSTLIMYNREKKGYSIIRGILSYIAPIGLLLPYLVIIGFQQGSFDLISMYRMFINPNLLLSILFLLSLGLIIIINEINSTQKSAFFRFLNPRISRFSAPQRFFDTHNITKFMAVLILLQLSLTMTMMFLIPPNISNEEFKIIKSIDEVIEPSSSPILIPPNLKSWFIYFQGSYFNYWTFWEGSEDFGFEIFKYTSSEIISDSLDKFSGVFYLFYSDSSISHSYLQFSLSTFKILLSRNGFSYEAIYVGELVEILLIIK